MKFCEMATAPADPILGLTGAFQADGRSPKANLGVGVFKDAEGRTPVLACVKEAEKRLLKKESTKTYAPIAGVPGYAEVVAPLVFGEDVAEARKPAVVQSPGGTGALRLGAELLKLANPGASVWIPDPSWGNHRALFSAAGFETKSYPYLSAATKAVDGEAMLAALEKVPAGDAVLLHVCCHNPTGADPDAATWKAAGEIAGKKGWLPFFDFAYQGFGDGLEEDRAGMLAVLGQVEEALVASSFSKNMGLYAERTGALSVVAAGGAEAALSQVKRIVRTIYSNAVLHGASIVREVLGDEELRAEWREELAAMQERISMNRTVLTGELSARCPGMDFSYLGRQKGMFSFSGLSDAQVAWLREEKAVYLVKGGRINVAGLMDSTMEYVCDSIAEAIRTVA